MNANRKLLTGGSLAVLAVLFVAVILICNSLFRGAQVDLTQNRLYTLSQGTKNILADIDEPIHLYLFWSDKETHGLPQLRIYAQRVREMLEEMASRAHGKIKLEVIDPQPFSEDEDRATGYGLQAVPTGENGEKIFLGLAGTNSTNGKSVIPFLQPNKEGFLEYDVAKLVHELTVTHKPVVGLVSGLEIGQGFDPATRSLRDPWAIDQQLTQQFDVRQLNAPSLKSIDKDIDVLVLIQPIRKRKPTRPAPIRTIRRRRCSPTNPPTCRRCSRPGASTTTRTRWCSIASMHCRSACSRARRRCRTRRFSASRSAI
jgi:ABC-type uncharacterized transport system involved in gliding motility auxiliary subunit